MLQSRRVLVVDDDAVVGRSINRVLSGEGYQVRESLSGSEALEELDHQQYDLVFTDIRMPGIDGLEMAARIKVSQPNLPVLVITGYGTEAKEQKARDLGVSGFLRKPLTPEMIESVTLKAMEKPAVALEAANEPEAPPAAAEPLTGMRKVSRIARNIGLFLAAPFIALGYVIALPAVGFYMFGKLGYEAYQKKRASK